MVTGEGTWTKGPFVKKTFLSFVLRTAAATIPPSSSQSWHAAYRRRKHLQKVRGAATKCLARLFEQSSIFATVSQLHKTAELVKKNSSSIPNKNCSIDSNTLRIRNFVMTTKVSLLAMIIYIVESRISAIRIDFIDFVKPIYCT